jgi:predicted signal transduction protein with EAL and GGDEF domain
MVRAIIAMARALGLRIVTEGVETEEQAEILRQLGSDEVQGYFYGYPESAQSAAERVWRELVPAAILTSQGRSLALLAGAVGKPSREGVTGVIMPHRVQ